MWREGRGGGGGGGIISCVSRLLDFRPWILGRTELCSYQSEGGGAFMTINAVVSDHMIMMMMIMEN